MIVAETSQKSNFELVPDFPKYKVSSHGFVYRVGKDNPLALRLDGNGYPQVILYGENGSKSFKVHKLVLCAFSGKKPEGFTANHKNGIKTDNKIENLEWISNKDNLMHSYINGLRKNVFNPKFIPIVREAYLLGHKERAIANYFCVNRSCINRIVNNKRWSFIK
jgi:hypothetical protein